METESESSKKGVRRLFQTTANGQPIPGIGEQLAASSPVLQSLMTSNDLASFFNAFFKTAIVGGAMLAVQRLGYAGFMYMTTESFGNKGKAKGIIQEAVIGLMLLLSIWIILFQINPNILNLDILQGVRSSSGAAKPVEIPRA